MSTLLLEIVHLDVTFGSIAAVRDLSFSIATGESLGLVGESGSGKSVTSLAIMRLLPPQARIGGTIRFAGEDLLPAIPERMRQLRGRAISMIFQEPMTALNPLMRVGDQVAEAILAHDNVSGKEAWTRAVAALDEVAIPNAASRARDYPHQLSGGQRQRVMIAMAIANRPQLLIADEPTTALDVTVQAQILELLARLREKFGLSMLFISHDLGVVSQVVDRIAVMYRGQVVESGSARQIFTAAAHEYTRGLLKAIPTLHSSRSQALAMVEARQYSDLPLKEVEQGHWARV
ncbi:MAG: peptide ABC transporter ATP-binding protein [Acidobacteria bacterium]|nr:MAG: peptide ABC transporter ATP-binding protein [Acidobacteriota bacterium]PYY01659.1 MAG: peptide ABC transporter ATP-binding protein [Acidobacteriota bacterium]PYY22362.1 MAG: peptide ABC transporter ATP-binding protein [Acidobacteriota bacterium]